ncbi:hypothetical protein ATCV1_Z287L [Acanthocystis turfacea chlorella virus 1]|uniref:Uncharacterized protein Z287L n=1 Tax=Chlorovirus heliozoae TaxID=322019 RepID=A7K8P7_9PHYC|nr:hypothetical protein ATCV1_Z287L [Acanthocystis turfacea chlorella virus 1]ABT16421.1 hypothetical protein ATCV1_Z287L [Acanthocystis turfacea chlorella virus 1]
MSVGEVSQITEHRILLIFYGVAVFVRDLVRSEVNTRGVDECARKIRDHTSCDDGGGICKGQTHFLLKT